MSLNKSAILAGEDTRDWGKPNSLRLAWDLALLWIQIIVPFLLYCWAPNPLTFLLAFVLIGGGQQGLSVAAHEFVHYTAIPQNRKLNDWIGSWLFSAPIGVPLPIFRIRHFAHHRHYSEEHDPKTLYRHDIRGWGLWREIILCMTGWECFAHLIQVIRDAFKGRIGDKDMAAAQAKKNSDLTFTAVVMPILITQLVLFSLASLVNPLYYFTLWVFPLITLNELLRKFRIIMEHRPPLERSTDHHTEFYRDTPDRFVRTVNATAFEKIMMAQMNFSYHAEHHLWPSYSYQYLPRLREKLVEAGGLDDPQIEHGDSFISVILKLWREPRG